MVLTASPGWEGREQLVPEEKLRALMDVREVYAIAGECLAYANHGGSTLLTYHGHPDAIRRNLF